MLGRWMAAFPWAMKCHLRADEEPEYELKVRGDGGVYARCMLIVTGQQDITSWQLYTCHDPHHQLAIIIIILVVTIIIIITSGRFLSATL